MKSLDKKKPKELKCIEDLIKTGWKVLYFKIKGDNLDVVGENGVQLLNYFEETLTQQRTEILEEIDKSCKETPEIIKKWKCSEKDGWYIKNVIDSFKSQLTNLLNKKDD